MKRYLLAGAAALACLAAGYAIGQQLSFRSLTGNEIITAELGIGGGSFFLPVSEARNAQGVLNNAVTTGTLTMTTGTASLIFTAASGGAQTINMPPTPWDGEIFEICNGTAAAFTTGSVVAATDGASFAGGATPTAIGALAAGTSIEWRFVQATNTWYRMR